MNLKSIENGEAILRLSRSELTTFNNALNEVCNGFDLGDEFFLRVGVELEEAEEILSSVGQIIDTLDASNRS